jgi:hypothetical protein
VRTSDKRVQFVGIDAYEAAGGDVIRDLFQQDDGGWLQNPVLLDRLVAEKLEREADKVRSEGWKWVEVAIDIPYGHTYGLRHISGESIAMSEEEIATAEALRAEYERLEEAHAEADELPEEVDQRFGEIETALAAFDEPPSSTTLRRSHVPVPSSASKDQVNCASNAATSVPKTNRQFRNPSRRLMGSRAVAQPLPLPPKPVLRRRRVPQSRRTNLRKRKASSRFPIG